MERNRVAKKKIPKKSIISKHLRSNGEKCAAYASERAFERVETMKCRKNLHAMMTIRKKKVALRLLLWISKKKMGMLYAVWSMVNGNSVPVWNIYQRKMV